VEAEQSLRRALELDPHLPYARGARLHAQLQVCDWSGYAETVAAIEAAVERDEPVDFPFSFLAVSDVPRLQLKCAHRFARLQRGGIKSPAPPMGFVARPAAPEQPEQPEQPASAAPPALGRRHPSVIRVAYLSADFLEHPTSYLMAGVFEKHDRQRFDITGICLRDDDESPTARRVKAAFDRVIPAQSLSDADLARRIRDLRVEVLVDLMGYTGAHRAALLAQRVAPVQANYLGFPGSTGSRDIDYLIADEFLIPYGARSTYTESIAYLPECFQANDDRRPLAGHAPTRAQQGLPATGLVLCSFHSSYKLNPPLFDCWARILAGMPGSVLWLLGGNPTLEDNVRREAAARGLSARQLVFARPLPYPDHLARLALADLCLDTVPFNGGATTSDALWAGVPVLTCAGRSFAARMSGSLLHAVGMPELVAGSLEEYERLALQIGSTPGLLTGLRAKLSESRRRAALFDTDRFRRHLEAAYTVMVDRQRSGLAAATFRIPATDQFAEGPADSVTPST
jgi:predicted O-linked N-acetylglucosamine transferase (SPINDLY family)